MLTVPAEAESDEKSPARGKEDSLLPEFGYYQVLAIRSQPPAASTVVGSSSGVLRLRLSKHRKHERLHRPADVLSVGFIGINPDGNYPIENGRAIDDETKSRSTQTIYQLPS
eukprot:jgi/Bigna1/128818/aug1.7_g3526